MTESDSSIMTTDNGIDTSTNVMTSNSTDIMTGNSQPLTRTIGKPKLDKDPNALKIASFRTKEGVWAEFSTKAESDGLTATDVLKAAMEQYLSGEYNPRVITGISTTVRHTNNGLTRDDVLEIVSTAISTAINTGRIRDEVSTAISTLSLPTEERVNTLVSMAVDTAVSTEAINSNIMTAISTLSLQTATDVNTLVSTALVPIEAELEVLKKFDAIG
jgi:hypothetical protein